MPNKEVRKDHKEEVRQQKAAAARAAKRAAGMRRAAIVVVLVALVGGGVMLLTSQRGSDEETASSPGASGAPTDTATLLSQAAEAAKQAGCDEPTNVGPFPDEKDQSHDGLSPLSEYPSSPPTSGPHSEDTVSAGTYDEPVDVAAAIHSLEHGAVIFWFDPSVADSPEIAEIRAFLADNQDHAVMAPYDYPDEGDAGSLPKGTAFSLTAWHYVQNCAQPSLPVVADFMSKYRTPPLEDMDYVGEAPEPNVPI